MGDDPAGLIERLAGVTSAVNTFAPEESAEFRRTLDDLADRMEHAVQLLRHVVERINPTTPVKDLHLTPRELEVLSSLAEGLSNTEIASRCWISENTVKFHLKNLFRKFEVRNRGQAIMLAKVIHRRINPSPHRR